jgi:hypothetical protein
LVDFVGRVEKAGLPRTARVRVRHGLLVVPLADQEAMVALLTRLGTGDLLTLRRRVAPTGRWACQRCERLWHGPRPPGRRWYELTDDGLHVWPGCFSYAFTHATWTLPPSPHRPEPWFLLSRMPLQGRRMHSAEQS